MPRWSNWSGRHTAHPTRIHFARSESDVAAVLRQAAAQGLVVRPAGAGHSHSPLVPGDGVVLDTSGLCGITATDAATPSAQIRAGTPIYALGAPLQQAGLGLINQGDIDRQSLAGACATGTHGTGASLGNLSSHVLGARIALVSGDVVTCGPDHEPELWQAARLNLGAVGVVTELTLRVRAAYRLRERGWTAPLDDLLPELPERVRGSRHFEFFWYPQDDSATAKAIDETDAPAEYPLAREGERCAWSCEVLPNHRPHRHTEMEYAVPAEHGTACFLAIRSLIRRSFPTLRWPVEYRTQAADDVWLSPAYRRAVVTISVHQDIREDEEPYFRACEEIFRDYDGRPHWGKVHYLGGDELARCHPAWASWWAVRDRCDPGATLLNDYLRGLRQ